jgi:hypothetical protein
MSINVKPLEVSIVKTFKNPKDDAMITINFVVSKI